MPTSPLTPPPPGAGARKLRRSTTDRVGAGVAGGLGEYFGVDPVLFRVLFAVSAFFGGAGLLAYLVAWAAIPDDSTERAALDGWVASLRERRLPFWLLAVGGGLVLWLVAFSWWAPGPVFPILAVVALLLIVAGRRSAPVEPVGAEPVRGDGGPVSLTKAPIPTAAPTQVPGPPAAGQAEWRSQLRDWSTEAHAAGRRRRRRAQPVSAATLAALALAILTLGIIDAAHGIPFDVYGWTALAVVGAGLLVGLALRRTPRGVALLLLPITAVLVATAGTSASLHDGIGVRRWAPTDHLSGTYKLAFGDSLLDLRRLAGTPSVHDVTIDQVAGRVRVFAPPTMKVEVVADVRFGAITVDNEQPDSAPNGAGVTRTVPASKTATGQLVTVHVHLSDGLVHVVHK